MGGELLCCFQVNASAVIIDPGGNADQIIEYVTDNQLTCMPSSTRMRILII
jgi:hypothetical protein